MKAYLITPMNLKYSYRATEEYVYKYAKYLHEVGYDVTLLITKRPDEKYKVLKDYKTIIKPYAKIKQRAAPCNEYVLPFKWHIFIYKDLPKDGIIYFPYSIYDYLFNILTKPAGQKYIIGSHSLHLKEGHIIKGHAIIEKILNFIVKTVLYLRKSELENIFFHAINTVQKSYLEKEFGIKGKNIFYIPNMINPSGYKLADNNSKKLRIIHIGGSEKGSDVVLSIVDNLQRIGKLDKFEFYFIGKTGHEDGTIYSKYKNVHFIGNVSNEDKLKLLSTVDSLIIPSYETFSKTLLEGLLSGLYILTSRRNVAWHDFISLGIKMFIANTGSPEEYLGILLNLANEKGKGKEVNGDRLRNRTLVIDNFDERNVLQKIQEMFRFIKKT
jgi:glycosyltransferase involved in cell wall biosynthesis